MLFVINFLSFFLVLSTSLTYVYFDRVTFEEIIFYLTCPVIGINNVFAFKIILICFVIPAILTFLVHKYCFKVHKKWKSMLSIGVLLSILTFCFYYFSVSDFFRLKKHNEITTEYFFPQQLEITKENFSKKNLIVIFLESMEFSYEKSELFEENLIPNLTKLAEQSASFSMYTQFLDIFSTVESIHSCFCGSPIYINPKFNNKNMTVSKLYQNTSCIPTLLKKEGYKSYFLSGSSGEIGNINNILKQIGFDYIWDKENPPTELLDMTTNWGTRDSDLYKIAREKLVEISQYKTPFIFVMATMDTHYPDEYFDSKVCTRKYFDFRDIVVCADKQISDFLTWFKQQKFSTDTAVVIVGDHLVRKNPISEKIKRRNDRNIVNIFYEIPPEERFLKRYFSSFDIAPSLLHVLGFHTKEDSFGYGINLFSSQKTMLETDKNFINDLHRSFDLFWKIRE